jgi:hypothetical protein
MKLNDSIFVAVGAVMAVRAANPSLTGPQAVALLRETAKDGVVDKVAAVQRAKAMTESPSSDTEGR